MTRDQLLDAFAEAPHYSDQDAFVSDILLSAVFLPPDDPEAKPDMMQAEPLRRVWATACAPFRDFLAALGLTQSGLSRRYAIPLRTVQHWALAERTCPPYLRLMLAELEGYVSAQPGKSEGK